MCSTHRDSMASAIEEEILRIEGLEVFCKPVETYNIIDARASKRAPLFLKRCLRYIIQQKYKERIQMKVVLPVAMINKSKDQNVYPVCVLLGKEVYGQETTNESVIYFGRVRMLYTTERANHIQANFLLPKMDELLEMDTESLSIFFISSAKLTLDHMNLLSFPANVEGNCLVGKISFDALYDTWTRTKSWSVGETADMYSTIKLHSRTLKSNISEGGTPSFRLTATGGAPATPEKLQVVVSAWELGVTIRNPYDLNAHNEIPSGSLLNLVRLRSGNVLFNYRQRDSMLLTTEVTEDCSCPFCLLKCVNFKGLECHLRASHDLFHFEFLVTEENQSVNVSPNFDRWTPKIVGHSQNRRFFFCAKSLRRRKLQTMVRDAEHTHRCVVDLNLIKEVGELRRCKTADPDCLQSLSGSSLAAPATLHDDNTSAGQDTCEDLDFVQPAPELQLSPPAKLQHVKTGMVESVDEEPMKYGADFVQSAPELQLPSPAKLKHVKTGMEASVDEEPMNLKLMQEGKFFHSQSGQPMTFEAVLSDHNSEDEIDDDIEDREDQKMLADFTDVSEDEKHMMHLWNSFVRRNRVKFRCHFHWACEAFTMLHGRDFVQSGLLWCWRLFMIKLWNQGLIDGLTMDTCNRILDKFNG